MSALSPADPNSFALPEQWQTKKIHLDLAVDFTSETLDGRADFEIEKNAEDSPNILTLDTHDLSIVKVSDKSSGEQLKFTVGDPVLCFGSKLEIHLPAGVGKKMTVSVHYKTSPQSTALQWLKAEQTAGKKHPYLFSQCQAIHARSLLPCQDTPAIKTSYTASISAPVDLEVLMSAVKQSTSQNPTEATHRVHTFHQKVPIPSYLIAIVVGAIESRKIGPRSHVWSEKEMVDKAAHEFAETEQMIQTAESILGPYVWGIYDLLVLPPSFPYGGMENPCLTFVTPTLLAGDRSLADVVAHEITHSWTGNLVTNKTSEHFWLNEGHTSFVERKIVARLRGEPHRHLSHIERWKDLMATIELQGATNPLTKLVTDLKGIDPDDAFSCVPYEKGSSLLFYLEQKLGGAEVFNPFLRAYIEKFKYKSLDTDEWKEFLYSFFHDKVSVLDEVDWNAWFYQPGMPPVKPNFDTSLADVCIALCEKWSKASDNELDQFAASDIEGFSSNQIREFLSLLLLEAPLSSIKMTALKELYKIHEMHNSEIRFRWLRLAIKAEQDFAIKPALEFVTEQGRMKFTRPLYRDLFKWNGSKNAAVKNFNEHRPSMHNVTATLIAKDLHL
ncbi:leukotriene A-4 hydrolase-like isoform X2 [Tubulanus polymorphus]|uniref:leukotriene A-4 hydrolase-like isoform X2 n=1 Tax=Tubulanus polymorphus TaxID=672921 RepID=UPI003DA35729